MSSCPSKMCLPADLRELVLWKNKQVTGVVLGAGLFFYFALFALDYSLLLFLCRVAQLAIIASVGAKFVGKSCVPQEECVQKTLQNLQQRVHVTAENVIQRVVIPIMDPKDLTYVGKIFGAVTLMGMVSSWFSTATLLLLVFVGVLTAPFAYTENKDKIDPIVKQVMAQVNKSLGGIMAKVPKPKAN